MYVCLACFSKSWSISCYDASSGVWSYRGWARDLLTSWKNSGRSYQVCVILLPLLSLRTTAFCSSSFLFYWYGYYLRHGTWCRLYFHWRLFVCLLAEQHKNYFNNFNEIFIRHVSLLNLQLIGFWWRKVKGRGHWPSGHISRRNWHGEVWLVSFCN